MEAPDFTDYYAILEVGQRATPEEIESKFRHLARRFHPDNQATGDRSRFDLVLEAHRTLADPAKRSRYEEDFRQQLGIPDEPGADEAETSADGHEDISKTAGIERDVDIQNRLLTILYVKRRRDVREPGIGDAELERMSGCPPEHLEFHLWYMKEKGWIARSEDGRLVITIDGVDRATQVHRSEAPPRLITDET
jgi:curved DNA-binding protein CbpA